MCIAVYELHAHAVFADANLVAERAKGDRRGDLLRQPHVELVGPDPLGLGHAGRRQFLLLDDRCSVRREQPIEE